MADTELDLLSASAVSSSFVSGQLGRARAQTKIVLLDCCYSGAFSRSLTTKDDRRVDAAEELRGIGRVIITASNALQYSFEGSTPSGDARQSVFTKHLVAGLETGAADLDGDGRIAVDELYRYVHDQVVQENPQQRPSISIETQGMVVVASSRAGIRPAVLPEELLSALANALPRVRLGATADLADILHDRPWPCRRDASRAAGAAASGSRPDRRGGDLHERGLDLGAIGTDVLGRPFSVGRANDDLCDPGPDLVAVDVPDGLHRREERTAGCPHRRLRCQPVRLPGSRIRRRRGAPGRNLGGTSVDHEPMAPGVDDAGHGHQRSGSHGRRGGENSSGRGQLRVGRAAQQGPSGGTCGCRSRRRAACAPARGRP